MEETPGTPINGSPVQQPDPVTNPMPPTMPDPSASPVAGASAPVAPSVDAAATKPVLPLVPNPWPGAFGAYKYSKVAVLLNIGTLAILYVTNIALSFIQYVPKVGWIIANVISIFISIAIYSTLLASAQGKKVEPGDALRNSPKFFLKIIGVYILAGFAIVGGFLLLIIPGLIILPRLILAPYYLFDKNLGVIETIKASWDGTKGHSGKVYGIIGAEIAMTLLMFTIIGIPFALWFLIMYSAAYAVLYEYIKQATPAAAAAAAPMASASVASTPETTSDPAPTDTVQTPPATPEA